MRGPSLPCSRPTLAKARVSVREPAQSPAQPVHRPPLTPALGTVAREEGCWATWDRGSSGTYSLLNNSGYSGTRARWAGHCWGLSSLGAGSWEGCRV